jgi:methyltransferase (TIGR00027 family)
VALERLTPTKTASAIARARADEAHLPEEQRLFDDPFARHFDDIHADVQEVFDTIPFFREQIRLRTRYLDDCVRAALTAGTRQIVLLGAGFDMRAARMPEIADAGAVVVEVDHAEQLAAKRQRLSEVGLELPAPVRHAPADLMGEPAALEGALRSAGIGGAPVLWVAEGLFGYLSGDALARMAEVAARLSAPGSLLVGNYFIGAFTLPTLVELIGPTGWTVEAGPGFDALHRSHIGPDVPPGSEAFQFLRATR